MCDRLHPLKRIPQADELVDDRVTVLEQTQSEEGYLWYRVRFASGAEGWIRGDIVQFL